MAGELIAMSAKCRQNSRGTHRRCPVLATKPPIYRELVPKEGFEPTHPYGYYVLNVARLPFRHFGTTVSIRL